MSEMCQVSREIAVKAFWDRIADYNIFPAFGRDIGLALLGGLRAYHENTKRVWLDRPDRPGSWVARTDLGHTRVIEVYRCGFHGLRTEDWLNWHVSDYNSDTKWMMVPDLDNK